MEEHQSGSSRSVGETNDGGGSSVSTAAAQNVQVSHQVYTPPGATLVGRMVDEDDELIQTGSPQGSSGSSDYGGGIPLQGVGASCEEIEKNLDEPSIVLESENAAFQQRMWGCFQNCARAVAQVYMTSRSLQSCSESGHRLARGSGSSRAPSPQPESSKPPQQVEESFKSAAQHATSLYKDSIETSRRLIDLAIKTGSNRRTKEVLAFVKSKKKRFIKRDELISFLAGGGGGSGKKEGGVAIGVSVSRTKNHSGGGSSGNPLGGGVFDITYPHVLHHVHSGGGAQGVAIGQQQSHIQHNHNQQLHGGVLCGPQLCQQQNQQQQSCQQSGQQHLRLLEPSQISSSMFSQRKHSNDFHVSNNASSTPQRLVISNNASFEDSGDPSSMLHLAVQQLFVAGAGLGAAGANEFVHLAGVKRPAEENKQEDDEEDCMMEDSVDGGSDCFKRMRFY